MKPLDPHPGHRALRLGRRSAPGQSYLLTMVTRRRYRHFGHFDVARAVARELGHWHLWRNHRVHAWVLMPDHVHLLCELADDETLSCLVSRVKCVTASLGNRVLGRTGTFWARGFHDHALRDHESICEAARYIIANPVRARLVNNPWEWPFWNSRWINTFDDLLSLDR